jgi:hypothetical protein
MKKEVEKEILIIKKTRETDYVFLEILRDAIEKTCGNIENLETDIEQLKIII